MTIEERVERLEKELIRREKMVVTKCLIIADEER